ncbi:AraC family transcriptional regulator [Paenibacillus sp. LMG 31460]|uniref:AraC family transcriptional regulator n=1 Tax=Paenibacillus germinis TaxID=2654979 RepID=A0ABX1Z5Q2_9BACL|nr:helix-turn-helix domain-containing protein [Paenibacillus germinis]NOU88712.1 AraC family transcriptional regulator [Paenibacillus germinis]
MNLLALFSKQKKSMLRKMITVSLFISIVPTVITGIGSYLYSSSVVETEVNKANYQFLKSASDNVDNKLQTIQINLLQLLNTPYFLSDYNKDLSADQIDFFSKVYKTLGAFQNTNKDLRELALYIPDIAYMSPTNGVIRPDGLFSREKLDNELKKDYRQRWLEETFPVTSYAEKSRGITLMSKFPLDNSFPIGLVLASVDSSLIRDIIGVSTVYKGQSMFVVNENGGLVATSSERVQPGNFYEHILQAGDVQSKYNFTWNDTTYLVTSITSNYSHWKYIDVIPVKELHAKSRGIAIMTMGIVFFFLLVGVIVSFLGSRKIYRPVERLLASMRGDSSSSTDVDADEMGFVHRNWLDLKHTASKLENELSYQLPIIRETFVLQLLQGQFVYYTDEQMDELLKRYRLPDQAEFAVIAIAFDMNANQKGRFRDSDKELMLFAMKNIIDDLIPQSGWQGVTVNVFNDSIVSWLWSVPGAPEWDKVEPDFFIFTEKMRETLANFVRLPVTAGLSGTGYELKELPEMYRQAMFALESRIIVGRNKVLQDEGSNVSEGIYPVELELHYENSLKLGNQEEAERMLNDFMDSVKRLAGSPEGVLLYYNQLLAATLRTAYALHVEPKQLFGQEDPYSYIRKLKSIEDINTWFITALIAPIIAAVQGNRHVEYERLVKTAVHYIHDNYNRDISLEECADHCGVSTFQLSKWFKKIQQTAFIDFLTDYRIQKAKQILSETDLPVSEVSSLVGYQRQNFMRVFKKLVGITPGQYRESLQKPPSGP